MKVVVGSRDLPLSIGIITRVASEFASSNDDEAFGVRAPFAENDVASPVERLVETIAERLGRPVIRFSPTRGGREATFHRDYDLVTEASAVLAFFSPEREMDGGTGHVVKAALDRGVKVDAYGVHPDGTLVFLGSDDADEGKHVNNRPNRVLQRMYEEAQEA